MLSRAGVDNIVSASIELESLETFFDSNPVNACGFLKARLAKLKSKSLF